MPTNTQQLLYSSPIRISNECSIDVPLHTHKGLANELWLEDTELISNNVVLFLRMVACNYLYTHFHLTGISSAVSCDAVSVKLAVIKQDAASMAGCSTGSDKQPMLQLAACSPAQLFHLGCCRRCGPPQADGAFANKDTGA
jgi:hypothetical protein